MAKIKTINKGEETIVDEACVECKGTGRGPKNGVYETTCEKCQGSGK